MRRCSSESVALCPPSFTSASSRRNERLAILPFFLHRFQLEFVFPPKDYSTNRMAPSASKWGRRPHTWSAPGGSPAPGPAKEPAVNGVGALGRSLKNTRFDDYEDESGSDSDGTRTDKRRR